VNTNNNTSKSESDSPIKLLLVEDDLRLSATIQEYLQHYEFEVDLVHRGDTAIDEILELKHDLVILDLMLPGADGLEVCRQVRQTFLNPILMLTARDDSVEQVVGLEIGADDYVTKPVEPRLLLARIRALLRHANRTSEADENETSQITRGSLTISQSTRSVSWRGMNVPCTRDDISERLNGYPYDGLDRSVDIRISRLRKKFEDNTGASNGIKTVRGKGYLFVESEWE